MNITNIHDAWGSTVTLDSPQEFFNYSPDYWRNMMYDRKLVVFKQVNFTKEEYAKFGTYFGKPWPAEDYKYSREHVENVATTKGIIPISPFSNINSKMIGDNEMPWHSDIPNRAFRPFPFRSLWITANPNPLVSGKTSWLNLEEGMNFLTPEMKELLPSVKVIQQSWYEQGKEIQEFPLLKIHPVTGRESLRLNYYNWGSLKNAWILDVKINDVSQGNCFLIRQWIKHLEKINELTYQHTWDLHDIAIYDNWTFLHCRTALQLDKEQPVRHFYRINIDHLAGEDWTAYKDTL